MRVGIGALEVAEQDLLREQLLRALQLAVRGTRRDRVAGWRSAARAGRRSRPCPASEKLRPLSIFLSSTSVMIRSMMSPTCSMLIVNDTMSAQRRPSLCLERLARDLRQVELHRRVQVVDDVVHLADSLGEHAIVGAEHRQHAVQHLLDDVADAQRFSRAAQEIASAGVSSADGSRWRGFAGSSLAGFATGAAARRCARSGAVKKMKPSGERDIEEAMERARPRAPGSSFEPLDPCLRRARRTASARGSRSA